MRKLILENLQAPGDIVMLTAAVRDLHTCYPNQFLTDVRTPYPQLWDNNPFITSLADYDPDAERIKCEYPLIHQSNDLPNHFIHGFIDFLNNLLGLNVKPTKFGGDIHLSAIEKNELVGLPDLGIATRYWIINAGGKLDFTIKWWASERFQEVVDYFKGKITFVQVGEISHYHPALQNVIDVRGKTDLRGLIKLVYHSDGVLTGVSLPMHLAAAVESKKENHKSRACVVIAGGREPVQWEAYPAHQFIHTIGALKCCATGGCWKSRVYPLGDGSENDKLLCVSPVGKLPRCMDMIRTTDVIRRIQYYL